MLKKDKQLKTIYNLIAAKKDWENLIKQSYQRNHQSSITKTDEESDRNKSSEECTNQSLRFDLRMKEVEKHLTLIAY